MTRTLRYLRAHLGSRSWMLHGAVAAMLVVTAGPVIHFRASADQPGSAGVTAASADGTQLELSFPSKALGQQATSLVLLPDNYKAGGKPWPVLYYLHGETGERSGGRTARSYLDAMGFASHADLSFVIVAPDLGDEPWCVTCLWVDGQNGVGVRAETHLHSELIPAVERALNVRADRGGRAVAGTGMGATGALTQTLRHPDVFVAAAALDPTMDLAGADIPAADEAALTQQGYPPTATAEALRHSISPHQLARNAVTANPEVLVAVGADESRRRIGDRVSAVWTELGLRHTYLPTSAVSAAVAETFRQHLLPRLSRAFDVEHAEPFRFSYHSPDRSFRVWGYDIAVDRENSEFLHVLGARTDGREATFSGTGRVHLRTPAAFKPGRDYRVVTTRDPSSHDALDDVPMNPYRSVERVVTADDDGRLAFDVTLEPGRVPDETRAQLESGSFPLHHTRVRVQDLDPAEPTDSSPPADSPLFVPPGSLPAPFDRWGVTATRWQNATGNTADTDQVLQLQFNSPALGLRSTNVVWLPDRYLQTSEPLPVLYYLHGTGGGNSAGMGFDELGDTAPFIVVATDTAGTWCGNCSWIDSRPPTDGLDQNPANGGLRPEAGDPDPRDADTYLHGELIPLVEAMFRARSDRSGRAVAGFSMGGTGALIQGLWHPDRFAYVGPQSGWLEVPQDNSTYPGGGFDQWRAYYGPQGYPTPAQVPALYRNMSLLDLAPQLLMANLEVVNTIGDGCVGDDSYCIGSAGEATGIAEAVARRQHDQYAPRIDDVGAPWSHPTWRGGHFGSAMKDSFEKYHLPRLLEVFADPLPEPQWFSFKSPHTAFEVWDYAFQIERPNSDQEFLNILGARRDGSDFTLAGTGVVHVTTPATFKPGHRYRVASTPDGEIARVQWVTADGAGRLSFNVELAAGRTTPEHEELVQAGGFGFPHTRVEVLTDTR